MKLSACCYFGGGKFALIGLFLLSFGSRGETWRDATSPVRSTSGERGGGGTDVEVERSGMTRTFTVK